jgi:glycosyltransferase involved in cell wall biosynthesis
MSCGLPVISSKYNGCWPELVRPENGWVFDPLDQENFVDTLHKTYEHKEHWETMGKASKAIVKDFSPKKVASRIFNSCKELT